MLNATKSSKIRALFAPKAKLTFIRFDDETIRKDGVFVVEDLLDLNPDRLG